MENLIILAGLRASHFVLVAVGFALVLGSCRVLNPMHGSYVMLGALRLLNLAETGRRADGCTPRDEAFVETATFLMSLISFQQRRQVRWDAVREEIA
jgi:branched-subunit amino acid ABC-type transport system permease component